MHLRAVFIGVSQRNWFCVITLRLWLGKLAPLFHPIRSKTKANRDSLAHVFPRFALATCNYFECWLVHCLVCVLWDWLQWLLWFWFCDTQLKTALKVVKWSSNGAIILIKLEKTLLRDMVPSKHYSVYTDNIPSPTHVHFLVTGLNRFTAFLDTTYNSSCTITVQR